MIECDPAPNGSNPTFVVEVDGFEPTGIESGRWSLPGLRIEVESDAELDEVIPFGLTHLVVFRPRPQKGCRFLLRVKTAREP